MAECASFNCRRPIQPGQRIVQVARGYFYEDHITPTLEFIECKWHERCFEGQLEFQSLPYTCHTCNRRITHGQFVTYVTIGTAPDENRFTVSRTSKTACTMEVF